jgi:PKD repeat protein
MFTDQSTNNPTSWKWEYIRIGSGTWVQFSTKQNPVYVLTKEGTYNIRLTVTNARGTDTLVKTDYITVNVPVKKPVAKFTQDRHAGRVPLTVHFTDRSLFDPTEYLWQFGDGTTSTLTNPVHTYTRPGVYRVQLQVSNEAGSSTTQGVVIALKNWWR